MKIKIKNCRFFIGKISLLLVVFFSLSSCQRDENLSIISPLAKGNDKAKYDFSKSFSVALVNEPAVRSFLKSEAMKMMNGDYDVLYALVKDKKLSSGKSFEETLAPYFGSIDKLRAIERESPLLTMFVPTLPENSFSAEKWDSENEIPFVAIRLTTTNDVPIISPQGEEYVLNSKLIPSYPVVVIKENERMVYSGQNGYQESKAKRSLTASNGLTYKFVDDIFDQEIQILQKSDNKRTVNTSQIDQKLIDAYNTYLNLDGWQRDQIYYNITPNNTRGQFSYSFLEHIRTFRISNSDAINAYYLLADGPTGYDQNDPTLWQIRRTGWTDGFFEFRTQTLIQAKNGVGSSQINSAWISGAGLFNYTYKIEKRGSWPNRYDYYKITSMTAREVLIDLPIVNWDLENYAFTLRIDIEEADLTTVIVSSTSVSSEFATNFNYEATIEKVGIKFGTSTKQSRTDTFQKTTTLSGEQLGSVLINFADNVIISGNVTDPNPANRTYTIREYNNNFFAISVEPKRVQP